MNIDDLTLGQIKQLKALFNGECDTLQSPNIGKWVIVRTYSAGVHFGKLRSLSGTHAILDYTRRLWSWEGAFTLSELTKNGFSKAKLSETIAEIELTEVIEVIPCTEEVSKKIKDFDSYEC